MKKDLLEILYEDMIKHRPHILVSDDSGAAAIMYIDLGDGKKLRSSRLESIVAVTVFLDERPLRDIVEEEERSLEALIKKPRVLSTILYYN